MNRMLILLCFAFVCLTQAGSLAAGGRERNLELALQHAGGNRSELETALRKVKGKDTEYLISHASQYDLVNLTAEMIIENITYARKVHAALPYLGEKLDDEMWREWVLPQRVLEEDMCLWRKEFYEMMQPVVAGKNTTAEVAEAIRFWLWGTGGELEKKVTFQEAENRLRSPVEIFKGGVAACGELSVLYVSFLRAVGIPARHCCTGWYQGMGEWHFYTEYWDNQLKRWMAADDSRITPAEKIERGQWSTFATRAVPGFNGFANAYFTEDFSVLLDVTVDVGAVDTFGFHVPGDWFEGRNARPADHKVRPPDDGGRASISVWNSLGWRKVAVPQRESEGTGFRVSLGQPKRNEAPALVTVVRGGEVSWKLTHIGPGEAGGMLEAAEPGVCLHWPK